MNFPPVETLLPHRAPQLLISRVVNVDGATLTAEGEFSPDQVAGYLPGRPMIPGSLLVEGLAQALACFGRLRGERGRAMLTSVASAQFEGIAVPPCTLTFCVQVTDERFRVATALGSVWLGARRIATATLSAALLPDELTVAETVAQTDTSSAPLHWPTGPVKRTT